MDRCVLIVGAGHSQVPAISAAKRLGWRTVAVDRSADAPGMAYADHAHVVDVVDAEAVLRVAVQEGVDGAITMQSDVGVPTVGFVNSQLGFRGVDEDTARVCSRKDLSRQRWADAGVPQPAFGIATTVDEARAHAARLGFPCVVKAADSSGSRGIVRVDDGDGIAGAWRTATSIARHGTVVVEAFVAGREVGAQTFSVDGACVAVHLHNDQVSDPPRMVPIGHSYPFVNDRLDRGRLEEAIRRAVEALGIRDGPANVDLIVDEAGRPMLLEIAARIGATCLPELTTLHTGVDWVGAALRIATGESPELTPTAVRPCAAMILVAPRDGVLRTAVVPDWIERHPDVVELEVIANPGDPVEALRDGTSRIGHVLVRGTSVRACEALAREVRAAVAFDVR